ncbi:uncharacterized protein A1O5_08932 [Cladophialophora psammophila CBS 110553]|uniref:Ketoreductase domain-containing protein n=1 Tax=Cladophialophora psammophila CBS 110553 TaxID=1182543 RepID=W9WJL7_9EURO|nr:uncharacterized protein A1O5_08932 [Cladophialophora psammophila CBS 110553]EXJ68317.1 hypothetical protein A1O5_08932 [Cladophialophora psammophila CBS 110553]
MSQLDGFDGLFRLDGKVALISLCSRGLGFHAATAFLRAGACRVILVSRNAEGPQGLNQAVQRLNGLQGTKEKAVAFAVDISSTKGVGGLVTRVRGIEKHIHILVASAAATWGGPFEDTPDAAVAEALDMNVRSVYNLIRVLPHLPMADPARIVIVGSVAGFMVPHVDENGTIIYAVSKAAVHHMARQLAVELGPRNIVTNAIAPGFFPSKLANGLIERLGGPEKLNALNPRLRLGEPLNIAGAMLYLCSRAASYMNGVVLPLDRGEHLTAGAKRKYR